MRFCYSGRVKIFLLLLLSFPAFAQSPSVATLHQTIQIGNAPYDAIITRPSTPGKHPAVFLIGGLGCYSLADLKPDDPFFQLLSGLTQRGYVTMRVDKNGEGKSGGPPCDSPQSDLQLAVRRSLAGLTARLLPLILLIAKIFLSWPTRLDRWKACWWRRSFMSAASSPLKPSDAHGWNTRLKMRDARC